MQNQTDLPKKKKKRGKNNNNKYYLSWFQAGRSILKRGGTIPKVIALTYTSFTPGGGDDLSVSAINFPINRFVSTAVKLLIFGHMAAIK